MDLFRDILLRIEEAPGPFVLQISGRSQAEVAFHAQLAQDAGFIDATYATQHAVFVKRLTYQGCEFLDTARNETFWKEAKEKVLKTTGSLALEALKLVLQQTMKHALGF